MGSLDLPALNTWRWREQVASKPGSHLQKLQCH